METAIGKEICPECGLKRTIEGYDGCLGKLPEVMNACCGHGKYGSGVYIQFLDKTSIHRQEAIEWINTNKVVNNK